MKHAEITLQTKKTIAASLKKFMAIKPLSKITVSEIINDCNINRKTFYYHFKDIYDLVRWMFEQEAIEVVKNFDLLVDYEEAIIFVIDYVTNNEHILNCVYDNISRDELKRFFYNDFYSIVEKAIDSKEMELDIKVEEDFKNFLCDFFTEALAAMLVKGFKNKNFIDKNKILNKYTVLIDSIPDILNKAPKQ